MLSIEHITVAKLIVSVQKTHKMSSILLCSLLGFLFVLVFCFIFFFSLFRNHISRGCGFYHQRGKVKIFSLLEKQYRDLSYGSKSSIVRVKHCICGTSYSVKKYNFDFMLWTHENNHIADCLFKLRYVVQKRYLSFVNVSGI